MIAVHDRCPCEVVSRPPAVGERADGVVDVRVEFCTHTQTHLPTLTSAPTNIHVVRQEKCARTEKKNIR